MQINLTKPFKALKYRQSHVLHASNGSKQNQATTIHRMIDENGSILVPGCYDALSARILHKTGHKLAFLSGYAVSATLLGEPDVGLLTPPEMSRKAGQVIQGNPDLPLLVDADTGGGNSLNVQRIVSQLIAIGAKGCFLEDQQWPKRSGHMRSKEVIQMEDFALKIYAARQAIGDSDFFLVARTDVRTTSAKYGLEDAITRSNLYHDAGADATLIEGPRSVEELEIIGKETRGIRVLNVIDGGVTPMLPLEDLKSMGFQLVVQPLTGLYAASKALSTSYSSLQQEGSAAGVQDQLMKYTEFNELLDTEERLSLEQQLIEGMGESQLKVKVKARTRPAQQ